MCRWTVVRHVDAVQFDSSAGPSLDVLVIDNYVRQGCGRPGPGPGRRAVRITGGYELTSAQVWQYASGVCDVVVAGLALMTTFETAASRAGTGTGPDSGQPCG
jgi:hypothetical protein